jgi:hypothetical protein
MDPAPEHKLTKLEKGIWGLFIGFLLLVLFSVVLGHFDNTTELIPDQGNTLQICFEIAIVSGLLSAVFAAVASKRMKICQRIGLTILFAVCGCISVAIVVVHAAAIVEGMIDFPAGRTRSYKTLIAISRAYQTHGKGVNWNIQTMPIWSNMDITEEDYKFMLAHRRPGDNVGNPDEISSRGYFCALVTVEQSEGAFRVLHAGNQKLPRGTVVLCPVRMLSQ